MRDQQMFQGTAGSWYKGNLHSHTMLSDAVLTPEEDARLYRENGYSFLCISDHDLYTDFRAELNRDDFLILPGLEYSAILYSADGSRRFKMHHMHGILGNTAMRQAATAPVFRHRGAVPPLKYYGSWDGAAVAQQMADFLSQRGMLVTYNHPVWSRVEGREFLQTKGLWAIEVYNYGTVVESNTGADTVYWDTMLRQGRRITAFASDDNHNIAPLDDSCGGWIMVKAPALTHDDLINAMLAGNYYSSSGPEIYAYGVTGQVAWVDCSPVAHVHFIAGNEIGDGWSIHGEAHADTLTHAEYRLKGHEDYTRIECVDKWGRTAWTNPLYFDKEK